VIAFNHVVSVLDRLCSTSGGHRPPHFSKASALSLVSNAILYWNTSRISNIVKGLRENGEIIDDDVLAHISLLPYKHVLPNGTYFVDGEPYGTEPTERAKP
jgi:Tn3 transposase DDE domain